MSDTVQYTGKLELIAEIEMNQNIIDKKQMEEAVELILNPYGTCILNDRVYDDWLDALMDCEQFVVHNGKIFRVVVKNEISYDDDVYEAEYQGEEITYNVKFYNGGCSFDEAIQTALQKLGV